MIIYMKKNLFQYGVLGFMVISALFAIALFAAYQGDNKIKYEFVMWGELPESVVTQMLSQLPLSFSEKYSIDYTYIEPENISSRLTRSLSEGGGPDVVLVSSERLYLDEFKLLPVPFEFFPVSEFEASFLSHAFPIYTTNVGWRGLPAVTDPLMLYSNRTLLATYGFAKPPATWQELGTYIDSLTTFDERGAITQSAIALGTFDNIDYAKEILISMMFQSGNNIVSRSQTSGNYESVLHQTGQSESSGPSYVLNHYMQYSDSQKSLYSWNQSSPTNRKEFIAGRLALYVAPASEYSRLLRENPNLTLEMSPFLQAQVSPEKSVYGRMYGYSITRRGGSNQIPLIEMIRELSGPVGSQLLADNLRVAPAHRTVFTSPSQIDFPGKNHVYNSALISKNWIDPDPKETSFVFSSMLQDVLLGRVGITQAVREADREIERLLSSS
jgi:ABC-type glycerol-3-phosphate transport system substrate-binding protein